MNINWKGYYEKEAEISDFSPMNDPSEIQRCLAAWTVFPRERISALLDAGCGDGFFCHWLSIRAQVYRIEGVDISQPRLIRAKSRYPNVQFVRSELLHLPYNDIEFDVVTSIEVLEHHENPIAALREFARVSRRYVVITVPDREARHSVLCPHCLKIFPASGHLHTFDHKRIAQMACQARLNLVRVRSYYPPMGATSNALPYWLGRILRTLELLIAPRSGSYLAALMSK